MQPQMDVTSVDTASWSVRMADSTLARYPVSRMRWHYEDGFLMHAVAQVGQRAGQPRYGQAVREYVDRFVQGDGSIATYWLADYNLDQIAPGRLLFPLQDAGGDARYRQATALLREQLARQPRTRAGGFWHKLIYPYQMWLDGIYMAGPFYAGYASAFGDAAAFDDAVHQIVTLEEHGRDPQTGLLYHAWDESCRQRWATPGTGCSPHFWGRAIGWYVMGIVDVLDVLPPDHPQRPALIGILRRALDAVYAVRDPDCGLWRQVLDQGGRPGNYLEASAACMYIYTMAKGVRQGYLPAEWLAVARASFDQVLAHFIHVDPAGHVSLHWTCGAAGLGGTPYRDGSYEYYVTERVVTNDPKGIAAFILAALELGR